MSYLYERNTESATLKEKGTFPAHNEKPEMF